MTYTKDFDLYHDDRVRITMPAQEPFPAGWAEGKVINANFYGEEEGWYIEFYKERTSTGWDTGYGYWKQGVDLGTVEKLEKTPVEPKYHNYMMEKVRQHIGLEPWDTSRDEEINNMSKDSVMDHCLEWEGIIGYGHTIRDWVKEIYGITLEQ